MKFIHTGDWHIGKIVNEISMIEDQQFVLEQLVKIIEEEKPDALVIAGDLYDRSVPSVEAVTLLDKVFSKILLELNTPIIAIAGNHDSAERVSFASGILTKNKLYIQGNFNEGIKKVELEDSHGKVNFFLIPYAEPVVIRELYKDPNIRTHEDAMKKLIEEIKKQSNYGDRNVIVAHGYVSFMGDIEEVAVDDLGEEKKKRAGLEVSDSERPLNIGGTDLISGQVFEGFTYTALGHLHGPQKVGSDRIRYSGSLLKYSFSEARQRKGVTLVEVDAQGEVSVDIKDFKPRRDMRTIKGPLKELINPEVYRGTNTEDYIFAVLTDEGELVDPISKLRAVYPNIMGLSRENSIQKEGSKTAASLGYKTKGKAELFKEFYKAISGKDIEADKLDIITDIIRDVERAVK
ncbi:exonuclease SbcCD subunit D [Clostridium manihotivorum]|uniref:Nuclease SbcCD subunit D n=1 Tax=Clostridium manihotivorum TaxID=2320868 RepID=A0A410DMS3_9CLOT|nr:exonuclease SbcCD subunit D [Clostridium manihotivorum]QAA30373.1 exonuclease sbcCD subunit D [Clostridium manihotivorum]